MENLSQKMEREGIEQKFFEISAEGKFQPEQIEVQITNGSLKRSVESENFIEQQWQQKLADGLKSWPNDTKPTRYRLAGTKVMDNRLILTLDPCVSYRDFAGSNSSDFAKRFGPDYLPRALAVTVILIAKNKNGEEQILMTLRKPDHDYKAGGYHISTGGFMEIDKETDPTRAALRELHEESGIDETELNSLVCIGVVANPWTKHSDIVYEAKTALSVEDILTKEHDRENNLLFIPTERKKLQQWLLGTAHAATGIATAGLLLTGKESVGREKDDAGQLIDGEKWYREMLKALAWRSEKYDDESVRKTLEKRDKLRLVNKIA